MQTVYELARGPLVWVSALIFVCGITVRALQFLFVTSRKERAFCPARPADEAPPAAMGDEKKINMIVRFQNTLLGRNPVMAIVTVVFHSALFIAGRRRGVKSCHAEHRASALAIARRDDRRMHIQKTAFLKKFMDGKGKRVADAEHASECVRARAQMRDSAQKFQSVPLFLERISGRVGGAINNNLIRPQFHRLTLPRRFDKPSARRNSPACVNLYNLLIIRKSSIRNHLQILNR